MKSTTPMNLIRIALIALIALIGFEVAPKLLAHPETAMLSLAVVAVADPKVIKAAIYTLDKHSLPNFIMDIAKAATDPFFQEFISITKDAAAVIEQLRFQAGLSEKDVADALGIDPNAYLAFVKSGKGVEITPDGVKALSKKLKVTVEELAAKMVASSDEPDADDLPSNTQTMNNGAQASGGSANPQDPNAAKSTDKPASRQVITIREAATSVKKEAAPKVEVDVLKMHLAGIRSDINVIKDAYAPGDLLQGGEFIPTEAKGLIDLLIADSDILSQVQTFQLPTKKMQVQSNDPTNIHLNRLATGWTSNKQKGASSFLNFDLGRVDIEFEIKNDTVQLFSNNITGLENFIYNQFRQAFMNRVAFLGWNGVDDSADDAVVDADIDEVNLAKGWMQLAHEQCVSGMKLVSTDYTTLTDQFDAIIDAQLTTQPIWDSIDQVIFLSKIDRKNYLKELQQRLDGARFLGMTREQIDAMTFDTKSFFVQNTIPRGQFLMAKPKNLGFGILSGDFGGLQVGRYPQPGSVLYRMTMWIDYALVNATKQIVISQ